jgi:nucleotide-binding universal stress UspA family protein/nitrite reductase/ring-hydroxylating ferredoxin subunit
VPYTKVLVATDGSETADIAARVAAALARAQGAELVLLTAFEPPTRSRDAAEQALETAAAAARERGMKASVLLRAGDPADAIMEGADEAGVDLIVVGNRGMGGARRFVLGGVPDRVSHYSPVDLLIVKTTAPDAADRGSELYRSVLIGTDGSPTADQVTRRGLDLARRIDARVTLVYVGDRLIGDIVLRDTVERLGDDRIEARLLEGDPAERICDLAEADGHDLVMVGNKGMAGARRFLLSAVPNKVSHAAPCDVLIAKTVGRSLHGLRPGEGAVVVADGKKVAAYMAEDGVVHAVSARCTHMGCTVGWNSKARTWDCPCHGSRYDYAGKVINGPAEKDLAPHELPREATGD